MSTPYTTIMGRLTADPELRFIPSGKAVVNFTIAASDRKKNDQTNEWSDGDKLFTRVAIWEEVAEQVAASGLTRGTEVIVVGQLYVREYEVDGVKRSSIEMKNARVAAEITKTATVAVTKRERVAAGQQSSWDTPPAGSTFRDEPPF